MEFRQDCLFHRQLSTLAMAMLLGWGILILSGSFLADMPFFSLFLLAVLLIPLIWCSLSGSRICIDESGIRCRSRKTVLWSYNWQEIQVLRFGRLNRYPILTVVPFDPPKQDLQAPQSPPQLYFQVTRQMKKNIKAICKCPFED